MEYQDYYKTLGVKREASTAEIRKAFRKLAREHHPDRNPGDKAAEKRFKDVNEAHAVLSDPEKRKQYDLLGADWERYARAGGPGAPGPTGDPFGPGGPFAGYGGSDGARSGQAGNVRYEFRSSGEAGGFSDFFRMFFGGDDGSRGGTATRSRTRTSASGGFDDILEQLQRESASGGGARASRNGGREEIEAPTELSLEEAYHGTSRIVDVEGKRYEVTLPRGADNGARIRLSGKGPGGRDVVVTVRVKPHPVFARRGADLERELPISLEEAVLGAEVPVPTLKGRVLLTIPGGTQNGRTFRLTGQGMPRRKEDGHGDLYVKVRVVLPGDLGDDAKAAALRFFELVHQPNPRTTS